MKAFVPLMPSPKGRCFFGCTRVCPGDADHKDVTPQRLSQTRAALSSDRRSAAILPYIHDRTFLGGHRALLRVCKLLAN